MGRLDGKPEDENGPTGGSKTNQNIKLPEDVASHAK